MSLHYFVKCRRFTDRAAETINTLFHVVNFLKCIVTEVVLLSIVAYKTLDISQGSVATLEVWLDL